MSDTLISNLEKDIELLRSREGYLYAGFPTYRRLFGRDTCIVSLQLLGKDPGIAKDTLKILAKYQGKNINRWKEEEPGKILHEHYPGGLRERFIDLKICRGKLRKIKQYIVWGFPYYGSIDATAWFLILYARYYRKTKDRQTATLLWPNILKALDWVDKYGDADGDLFIENIRKNPFGLSHQGWKDMLDYVGYKMVQPVAMVEVQGYYYLAYLEIAYIARILFKDMNLFHKLKNKAKKLKKKFNRNFWMEDESYYSLALDGNKRQVKSFTSNPGHLIFTGIMERRKQKLVIKRLFSEDFFSKWGIQTQSSVDPLYDPKTYHGGPIWPSDNWIIFYGLYKIKDYKHALMIKNSLIRAYRHFNGIPELYRIEEGHLQPGIFYKGLPVCELQAWASCGLLDMLTKNI